LHHFGRGIDAHFTAQNEPRAQTSSGFSTAKYRGHGPGGRYKGHYRPDTGRLEPPNPVLEETGATTSLFR
jgi:hypothetical protein